MIYFIMTVTIVTAVTVVFDPGLASTGYVSTYPLVGGSRLPPRSVLLPSAEVSAGEPHPQTPGGDADG